MFTAENGKKVLVTMVSVLAAMFVYQKFVAPMLVKKPTVAAK
jgi:hypothetical protein